MEFHWRDDTSFFWLVKVTEYFFEPCWRDTASLLVLWTHSEGMRHAYRNFGDFTVREHQRQASIIRFFAVGAATIDKGAALSEGTNWMEISLLDARCDSMWFDVIRCDWIAHGQSYHVDLINYCGHTKHIIMTIELICCPLFCAHQPIEAS